MRLVTALTVRQVTPFGQPCCFGFCKTILLQNSPVPRSQCIRAALHRKKCDKSRAANVCCQQQVAGFGAITAAALAAGAFLVVLLSPAGASVLTERIANRNGTQQSSAGSANQDAIVGRHPRQSPSTSSSSAQAKGLSVREQATQVLRLTAEAKQATSDGQYKQALDRYNEIVDRFPDLAITNYAKIGRALLLYQTGSTSQAILELEDLEVALRGFAEVHAALACLVYAERPAEISYAEGQFDLASEFDSRYSDVDWVAREKLWPPAMLASLDKFLNLR